MRYKSERAKACAISRETKLKVYERDGGTCILCGCPGLPEAHYIPRSRGGLGIEQNIITLCRPCHREFDEGQNSEKIAAIIADYFRSKYEGWNEDELIYKKYGGTLNAGTLQGTRQRY